jgi:CubicO group peptidase (beta-lactamase class C family)
MENASNSLPRSVALIERGITDGRHLGAQLYVSSHGEVLADDGIGESRLGVPMRPDTILLWLSSAKPVTAVAIAQLWEQGRLGVNDAVIKHIPEFGQGGKEGITIRHLLTHTGGIRAADKCDLGKEWQEIVACICATPLDPHWVPGQRAGYHPSASWYVLGEIVRRIDGRPFDQYVRQEIFGPCGMRDAWLALPPDQFRRYGDRLGIMFHTDKGAPSPHRKWNTEADAAVCRPGRNGRGPTRELGRFYEILLQLRQSATPTSPGILRPETVRELTTRQRVGLFDETFQQVIDWGLGFAIDSKRYGREMVSYGYGRFASEDTFGHGGSQSSCAFADPAHGLVVAWAFNGLPGERRHQHRAHELNTAIYEDLSLA